MDVMLLCFFGGLIAIGVVLGVYLLVKTSGTKVIEVPQEERVVLYRLGRFSRVAGPGLITLTGFEREVRRINVRSEYGEYRTNPYYFINGVPFNYTVSFWRIYDLPAAANGNHARLAELVQYTDDERRQHLVTKLHEAFHKCVKEVQKRYPVDDKEPLVRKLLPVLPGLPGCDALLALLREELLQTLPLVGVTMDTRHPFMVASVHIPPDVIDGFIRDRSLSMLREQLPGIAPDLLLQAFAAIEGLDMHTVRLYMNGGAVREVKMEGETVEGYKVVPEPVIQSAARSELTDSPLRKAAPAADTEDERLSKADLSVLKRLPPAGARRAAS